MTPKYIGRKLADRVASLPAYLAFWWTKLPPVFRVMEKRYARDIQQDRAVEGLRPVEAAIVAALERDGIFVTDLEALGLAGPEGFDLMERGRRLTGKLAGRVPVAGKACPAVIVGDSADLIEDRHVFQWGLNAVLLRIAEAYLHQPVAYDGPIAMFTPADGREAGTRLWHLDREDRRVIKVALYLNDVDADGGPFQLITTPPCPPNNRFGYSVLTTNAFEQLSGADIAPDSLATCTGKAGSLVFADAARFYHRGKPPTDQTRSAIFFSYFARRPRHPFFCGRSRLSQRDITDLVEELHPAQQASALWRRGLPWWARLIPPSLL